MIFGSVCSGIEAASVAWSPLGWRAAFVSEIDPAASAVLAHHYHDVPNLGDMTRFQEWPDAALDVLCGGTPCQSFSVAGLRGGLADPRGNLALTFLAIADRYRPRWVVWENVLGLLSSDGGRDFAAFLGGLGQLGYGWAYRVLDAQYVRVDGYPHAVPQRRRRVFVVGCLGSWASAAAVLFEPESLRGHSPPRREAGQVAPTIPSRRSAGGGLGTDFDCDGGLLAFGGNRTGGALDVATAVNAHGGPHGRLDFESETFVAHAQPIAPAISASNPYGDHESRERLLVAFDARQSDVCVYGDRAGSVDTDAYSQAIAFDPTQITSPQNRSRPEPGDPCHTLAKGAHAPAIAFQPRFARNDRGGPQEIAYPLTAEAGTTGKGDSAQCVATAWAVRRLTPLECCRLQGFPDDYFDGVRYRRKPLADGPIYKMLGNSWAIPPVRWIGRRIDAVEALRRELLVKEAAE